MFHPICSVLDGLANMSGVSTNVLNASGRPATCLIELLQVILEPGCLGFFEKKF